MCNHLQTVAPKGHMLHSIPLRLRNKVDGKGAVFEGQGGKGSMALEVCLASEAVFRIVANEFMCATTIVEC